MDSVYRNQRDGGLYCPEKDAQGMNAQFNGAHKRHLDHFLLAYERAIINTCLPFVPKWISTVHLTLMTFVWSAVIVLAGYLAAAQNIQWLWLFSLCVFLQHVTDMLDGEVGRSRETGLVKWGFYMDHFLDFVFVSAIVGAYAFLLPPKDAPLVLLCLAVLGGFMVHVFLDFGITNDLKISFNRFGPSEGRYAVIALNTVLIFGAKDLFIQLFPLIVVVLSVFLAVVVYQSQKTYWVMDQKKAGKIRQ